MTKVMAAPPHKSQRNALFSSELFLVWTFDLFYVRGGLLARGRFTLGLFGLLCGVLRFILVGIYCPVYRLSRAMKVHIWQYLVLVGSAFIAVGVLTPIIRRFAISRQIYDDPNSSYKSHAKPIPYLGAWRSLLGSLRFLMLRFLPMNSRIKI